jgi:hypothetical protein
MKDDTFTLKDGVPSRPTKLIRRLRARNILAEFPAPIEAAQMPTWLSTRAVARWACDTASAMAQAVLSIVPEAGHPQLLSVMRVFRVAFAPVE